jgi:hypothetical protein
MAYDYIGSIAQKDILFRTVFNVSTVPGANFGKVMIFMLESDAATYFVTDPGADTITEVNSTNYASLTLAKLQTWLQGFFMGGTTTVVEIVTVQNIVADLTAQYAAYDERAYWKTFIGTGASPQVNGGIALAKLCSADTNYLSQFFWGSNDATILTGTAGNEHLLFTAASPSQDVPLIYHPSTTMNPALVQLGATMAAVNSTGTYVGNKLDFTAVSNFTASGAAGANLTAAQIAQIQTTYGDSFFTTLGDGSGRVVAEKWATPLGSVIGAVWMTNYIDITSAIYVAQYIASSSQLGFKNNDSYQACLAVLQKQLNLFIGLGRLSNVQITAPTFSNLPAASGGTITVPNAWTGKYNDNLRQVTVYGTLTIAT